MNVWEKLKKSRLNNLRLFFSTIEKALNNFKSRLFPIKSLDKTWINIWLSISTRICTTPETTIVTKATKTKTKCKISPLKFREEFLNEIKNEGKNTNELIFREYFNYLSPSFLVKVLCEENQNKNDIIVKYINESLIDIRNSTNSKEIPDNGNPKKSNQYCWKNLRF